jgi:PAS domain S-box-containing protein
MAAVVALGAGCVIVRIPEVTSWTSSDLLALAALTATGILVEQFSISIRHRTETENFVLTDAVWVPALLLGRPSVLILAVVLTTVIGQTVKRWAWYKIAFNAGQFALAITAAEAIRSLFPGANTLGLEMWGAAVAAMAGFFVVNEVLVAMIISRIEREPLGSILVLPAGLNLFHAAANITIGMIATLVWVTGPAQLPLVLAPVALSFLAYRGWFQSNQEERQAKELMRTLYEAGQTLFGRLDMRFDFRPFLGEVGRMVNASQVQLVMVDGDTVRLQTSERDLETRVRIEGRTPAEHLSPAIDDFTHVAPIILGGETIGALAVRRRPTLSPSEASLIDALASQVSTKEENERLFRGAEHQRSHLADVIANSSDGIFVVGADGMVGSWNPAMERISRVRERDAVGRPVATVLRSSAEGDGADEPAMLALVPGASQSIQITRGDGTQRWIRYAANPLPGDHGEPAFVVVASDVTAEMQTERMKADFVATVSHELRTPLTPLKGFLLNLREADGSLPAETRREYYDIMIRQTERLEKLIGDLLDASTLNAGGLSIESSLVELGRFVPEHLEEALRYPLARPIGLTMSDEPVWIHADPFRIGQVLANLLSNAFKYSPPDGAVRVEISGIDGRAVIAVHDEGDGIPPEDHVRVFDRFYRVENGLTRNTSGAGLGLYIAKHLVEAMGGALTLSSVVGKGTSFFVSLPRIDPDIIEAAEGSQLAPAV